EGLEEAVVGGAEGDDGGLPAAPLVLGPRLENAADELERDLGRLVPARVPRQPDEEVVREAELRAGVDAVVGAEGVLELEVLDGEAAVEVEAAVDAEAVLEGGPLAGEGAEEGVPLAEEAAGRAAQRPVVGDREVLDAGDGEEEAPREGDRAREAEAAAPGGGVGGGLLLPSGRGGGLRGLLDPAVEREESPQLARAELDPAAERRLRAHGGGRGGLGEPLEGGVRPGELRRVRERLRAEPAQPPVAVQPGLERGG